MGFWGSNSSTYLANRVHGQLTMAPVFHHVSRLVLIFHFTSQPLNLIAASVVFTHLFIGHLSQENHSTPVLSTVAYIEVLTFEIVLTMSVDTGLFNSHF